MKKRVLATLLCVAMTATLLVGCGGGSDKETGSEKNTESQKESEKESEKGSENAGAELSVKPVVYYPFESADEGWKVVVEAGKEENIKYDAANNTGSRGMKYGDMSLAKLVDNGVAGKMLQMDREYALDLNFEPTKTKEWSVSFWVCHSGVADFGPSLQFGSNMSYAADNGNKVAWLNVTSGHGEKYPVLWSRNEIYDGPSGVDCWPWMCPFEGTVYGQTEWAMVTIVCDGIEQQSPIEGGGKTVGAQLYVNGELKYDSTDNFNNGTYFEYTWDATMAPDLMIPAEGQTFEAYFGINYWDTMYRGYVDEFYVFDKAITADDVKALYAKGDATNPPKFDPNLLPKENPRVLLGDNSVGFNDYTQPWWSDFSNTYKVEKGKTTTVTFKNYHTNLSFGNYMNAAVVLQNVADVHSTTENAAYAEYAVVRMDNYGWLGTVNTNDGLATLGWTLENDWDFTTADAFKNATHDATVVLKVTNNGTTADVVMEVTAKDGTVHKQSYKNIAVSGDLYFCLTVEKACIDISSVDENK